MVDILKKKCNNFEVMRDMKRIEIKECGHAVCGCNVTGHTPAEQKFLNKLTVGVCVIAALIMYAAYHLFPIIN